MWLTSGCLLSSFQYSSVLFLLVNSEVCLHVPRMGLILKTEAVCPGGLYTRHYFGSLGTWKGSWKRERRLTKGKWEQGASGTAQTTCNGYPYSSIACKCTLLLWGLAYIPRHVLLLLVPCICLTRKRIELHILALGKLCFMLL